MEATRLKPAAVIVDVDGTLADVQFLRHLVAAGLKNKNFDEFHRRSVDAMPHGWVVEQVRDWSQAGANIITVTARQEQYRPHTAFWLALHNIPSDELWMRPAGDFRPDVQVKSEILARLEQKYKVVHAIDDRPDIAQLWESHGIGVTLVPGWSEEA